MFAAKNVLEGGQQNGRQRNARMLYRPLCNFLHSPVVFFFTVHTLVGLPGNSETAISDT